MNIRHLRYFVDIVATGSLRKASEVLYVTQSALSRAVSELESELGCTLLERHQHGVRPTRQGLLLEERARGILGDVEGLKQQLVEDGGQPAGQVRLAMPIGMRNRITRPLVRFLREEYPNVRVDLQDGNAHENRAAVLEGMAEMAVIQELDRGLPLNYRRLFTEPLCLVGPSSAGLRLKQPVSVATMAAFPLLMIHAPNQIRWTVDAALRSIKAPSEPAMEVSSSILLLDLVEDGQGYTVLPESVVAEALLHKRVSAARVRTLKVTWVVAWIKGKALSPVSKIALDKLCELAASHTHSV